VTTSPDEIVIGGARPLRGKLRVPGDKSISHRGLIFGAMADGASTIENLATGDDVRATGRALAALGVAIDSGGPVVTVHGRTVEAWSEAADVLDCANSGTTMRVLAGAVAGRDFLSVLTGDSSLRSRPMARVVEPLRAMGAFIDGRDRGTRAPLVIRGGSLRGIACELPVASAQVKSALVLAGLQGTGETTIVSPEQSRDHTERMLRALGAPVQPEGLTVRVLAGRPRAFALDVPGDPSSAAFFAVAATITPGSDIVLEQMSCNPTRVGFVDVLRRMGADLEIVATGESCGEPIGELHVRASSLGGTVIAGSEIPNVQDEVPVLAVAAAFADGVTEIRDAAELTRKESDRIRTVHTELRALGVAAEANAEGLVVRGGGARSAVLRSHGDHRVAMAMAVAANALDAPSTVREWSAVSSSYPDFAADLGRLTGVS
jgi:3-phosphoshikimate 1-carboxyvinyltransferase